MPSYTPIRPDLGEEAPAHPRPDPRQVRRRRRRHPQVDAPPGARMIEQVLKSAMANAEDKGVRNVGDLIVSEIRGDGGPMFKRLMPRARGMAYMIRRRKLAHRHRPVRPGNLPVARCDSRSARKRNRLIPT